MPAMVKITARPSGYDLYDRDFCAWTETQAAALRAAAQTGANLPVDWENVAEEIESMGRSDVRELRQRIATIIEHLLKLEFSPADAPRAGWRETVARSRQAVANLLADSPSLAPRVPALIEAGREAAAKLVLLGLAEHGETDTAAAVRTRRYDEAEVLGDWFPD
jgi:hypothetical protein